MSPPEPFRSVTLVCPGCRPRATLLAEDKGARCAACGGWFLDEGVLLARIREAQPSHPVEELLEHNDGSPRRPCPQCGERMSIVWLEYLQLEQCPEHGVWFDRGELDRALAGDTAPRWIVAPPRSAMPRR
jgi:Zn-finger nucleic acid-binding protein